MSTIAFMRKVCYYKRWTYAMKKIEYNYDISPPPSFIDEDIEKAHQLLRDIDGGTVTDGMSLASKILEKINSNIPLTHNLIIFGERFNDPVLKAENIRAEDSPFNKGLVRGFGVEANPNTLVGGTVIEVGNTGLRASLECVWEPENPFSEGGLHDNEIDGLKRHIHGDIIDDSNPEIKYGGVLVLPKFALRAKIVD